METENPVKKEHFTHDGYYFSIDEGEGIIARGCLFLLTDSPGAPLHGSIQGVWVHPGHRRQGLATKILEALLKEADERGCTHVTGTVRVGRREALALYKSLGVERYGHAIKITFEGNPD